MILSWLRDHRRRQLLAEPFPREWLAYLEANVFDYRTLGNTEQAKLRNMTRIFISEKTWEGCGGLTITDEIKVTIAGQACLIVLSFDNFCFENVRTILVYPRGYVAPAEETTEFGIVDKSGDARLGEAHYRGPVVLSWSDALAQGKKHGEGRNLVYHEFAHELDMLDGRADGIPPLPDEQVEQFRDVMEMEYQRLVHDAEHNKSTLLDVYGATNMAEFFAVATECFFERPVQMHHRHPQLYEVLRDFYRQDPAERQHAH